MSGESLCQMLVAMGIVITAAASWGAYHFSSISSEEEADKLRGKIASLETQLSALPSQTAAQTVQLLLQTQELKKEEWHEVEMKYIPTGGVVDYALILFEATKGRISGKVRMKGSPYQSAFFTTANKNTPVAVRCKWRDHAQVVTAPNVMEYLVTEVTDPTAELKISTAGWIDTRDREEY